MDRVRRCNHSDLEVPRLGRGGWGKATDPPTEPGPPPEDGVILAKYSDETTQDFARRLTATTPRPDPDLIEKLAGLLGFTTPRR